MNCSTFIEGLVHRKILYYSGQLSTKLSKLHLTKGDGMQSTTQPNQTCNLNLVNCTVQLYVFCFDCDRGFYHVDLITQSYHSCR